MSEYISYKTGKEIEWLELNLLKNNRPLNKSQISTLADDIEEQTIDGWLTTLEWRSNMYKKPIYTVNNNKITPNFSWKEIPEYFLCLYYSFYGANDNSGGTGLFEKISAETLKNFIQGEVYNLGFPISQSFNKNLDDIANYCFEQRNLLANSNYKDDGVDVVGYKLFGDDRSSNLYILLQCAAGKHWASKKPIIMNRWTNYIIWFPENIIQSISTVEFVEQKNWNKNSSTFGMLIDRLRIYNFLYEKEVETSLRKEVLKWCENKIASGI